MFLLCPPEQADCLLWGFLVAIPSWKRCLTSRDVPYIRRSIRFIQRPFWSFSFLISWLKLPCLISVAACALHRILFPSSYEGEYFFPNKWWLLLLLTQGFKYTSIFSHCFTSTKFTPRNRKPIPYTVRDALTVWWPSFYHLPHFSCSTYSCETAFFSPFLKQQSATNTPQFDACFSLQNILGQKWHQ